MKKLLLTLVALVAAMSMSAQVITVMKGGKVVKAYNATEADEIYIGEFQQREFVDLGLSVLWATTNVGANKSTDEGDFFAWGEVEPYYQAGYSQESPCTHWKSGKTGYTLNNYKYYNSTTQKYTKYNATDGKTVLDKEDDAATVNWGSQWRMPTKEEFQELIDKCTWVYKTNYNSTGKDGYLITSNIQGYQDKSIFLPAAGYRQSDKISEHTDDYWTSSHSGLANDYAYHFIKNQDGSKYLNANARFYGLTIRAVMDKY